MKTKSFTILLCVALIITTVFGTATVFASEDTQGNTDTVVLIDDAVSPESPDAKDTSDGNETVEDKDVSEAPEVSEKDAVPAEESSSEGQASDTDKTGDTDNADEKDVSGDSDTAVTPENDNTDKAEPAEIKDETVSEDNAEETEKAAEESVIEDEKTAGKSEKENEETAEKSVKADEEKGTEADKKTEEKIKDAPKKEKPKKQIIDGKTYFVYKDGTHYTGWYVYTNGRKSYCDPENDGACAVGYKRVGTRGYLFSKNGIMYIGKGLIRNGGKWYYVYQKGSLAVGWKTVNGNRMYFDKTTNAAKTGIKKINGKLYLFNDNGFQFRDSGTPVYKGNKYWIKKNGTLGCGWLRMGDYKMYFSSKNYACLTGLRNIGKKTFLFNSDGILMGHPGTPVIDGHKYWCRDDCSLMSGWLKMNGMKMYFFPDTFYCATGKVNINGKEYNFDRNGVLIVNTGRQLVNGTMYYYDDDGDLIRNQWVKYNGEKIYVNGDGVGLADLSDKIGGPYVLYVDRSNCVVTAYTYDGTPVRSMLCSVGLPGMSTPYGTWMIYSKYALKQLMGPSWGKWACNVDGGACGGIYFHSVATGSASDPTHSVPIDGYNNLGNPASHGCIRLCVRDAKWIYDHCGVGTTVYIGDNFSLPFGRPFLTKISTPVDPTDPEA